MWQEPAPRAITITPNTKLGQTSLGRRRVAHGCVGQASHRPSPLCRISFSVLRRPTGARLNLLRLPLSSTVLLEPALGLGLERVHGHATPGGRSGGRPREDVERAPGPTSRSSGSAVVGAGEHEDDQQPLQQIVRRARRPRRSATCWCRRRPGCRTAVSRSRYLSIGNEPAHCTNTLYPTRCAWTTSRWRASPPACGIGSRRGTCVSGLSTTTGSTGHASIRCSPSPPTRSPRPPSTATGAVRRRWQASVRPPVITECTGTDRYVGRHVHAGIRRHLVVDAIKRRLHRPDPVEPRPRSRPRPPPRRLRALPRPARPASPPLGALTPGPGVLHPRPPRPGRRPRGRSTSSSPAQRGPPGRRLREPAARIIHRRLRPQQHRQRTSTSIVGVPGRQPTGSPSRPRRTSSSPTAPRSGAAVDPARPGSDSPGHYTIGAPLLPRSSLAAAIASTRRCGRTPAAAATAKAVALDDARRRHPEPNRRCLDGPQPGDIIRHPDGDSYVLDRSTADAASATGSRRAGTRLRPGRGGRRVVTGHALPGRAEIAAGQRPARRQLHRAGARAGDSHFINNEGHAGVDPRQRRPGTARSAAACRCHDVPPGRSSAASTEVGWHYCLEQGQPAQQDPPPHRRRRVLHPPRRHPRPGSPTPPPSPCRTRPGDRRSSTPAGGEYVTAFRGTGVGLLLRHQHHEGADHQPPRRRQPLRGQPTVSRHWIPSHGRPTTACGPGASPPTRSAGATTSPARRKASGPSAGTPSPPTRSSTAGSGCSLA